MKRVTIIVTGRVQGVFFRVYTRDFVRTLHEITGYVCNLPNGAVKIVAEGLEVDLKKLANWARNIGSPHSQIVDTKEIWSNINEREFLDFQITYCRS
ncbi:MAG: acylphosphatase [Candidatus Heimdallarchaeota archaeon]|nr:acylphosphatase [Candidatus Heimdallarchaeota archaeon]